MERKKQQQQHLARPPTFRHGQDEEAGGTTDDEQWTQVDASAKPAPKKLVSEEEVTQGTHDICFMVSNKGKGRNRK